MSRNRDCDARHACMDACSCRANETTWIILVYEYILLYETCHNG